MSDTEKGNLKIEDSRTNFPNIMRDFNGGVTGNIIGQVMSDVALAVAKTNRKGSISITLDLKPGSSEDNEYLNADFTIKMKQPKMDRGYKAEDIYQGSIVFVGKGGKCSIDRLKESHTGQVQLSITSTDALADAMLTSENPSETSRTTRKVK